MEELRLLAGPDRLFSAAQAKLAGYRAADLARLIRGGSITHVDHGWYAVGAPESEQEQYRLRTSAAQLRQGGRAVASHHSELVRLGLPLFQADLRTVHLSLVGPGTPRRRSGIAIHPRVTMSLTDAGRIPPQLAVVQGGITCGPMAALIAADAALNRGLLTKADLEGAVEAVRGKPGTALIGPFLALADGRAQSPGETRLRHAFHLMSLPVTPQAPITDGVRTAYVDFLLDDDPVVVEFDGAVKYGAGGLRPGQTELVAEKDREDWLRHLGYEMVRVIWRDLDDLVALARRFAVAIRRARARRR
ncbi:MAG: hypothetical protein ACOYBY_04820 [Dermatophilaceae bacterium]